MGKVKETTTEIIEKSMDNIFSMVYGEHSSSQQLKELQKWLSIVHPNWLTEYNAVKDIEREV